MSGVPSRCVVDTNVAVTANGANEAVGRGCVAASARALQAVMSRGHLYIDDAGRIVTEYRHDLRARGEPGAGDAFLRWVLTHEWGRARVTRVPITPKRGVPDDFHELPAPPPDVHYDPSDRKFLAVAAAHRSRPPVLQSCDSKWWGWRSALAEAGITVCFLCEAEIAAAYARKAKD